MIRKLQYKFIIISTLTVSILITLLLVSLNQMFYQNSLSETFNVLSFIADRDGEIPRNFEKHELDGYIGINQIHCFSVKLEENSKIVRRINVDVTRKEAIQLAQRIIKNNKKQGQIIKNQKPYCFVYTKKNSSQIVAFMDCYKEFYDIQKLRDFSTWFGVLCLLIFFVIVTVFSRRAVQPVIRNIDNQKQFVTNASHELKTPIAIISANIEFLEMMHGENEWTKSSMNQINRLSTLISNLIILSKLNESSSNVFSTFYISDWLNDNIKDFEKLAYKKQITIQKDIEPNLKVNGVQEHLKEMLNILCDNAVKYCDKKGKISISLNKKHSVVFFTISNSYKEGKNIDYTKFFDRFYREDHSHNNKVEGYGIGLAMAEGFAEESKSKISVDYKDDEIIFTVKF